MLSDEQVKHVAKLARIDLKDEEVRKFGGELSKILDYMDVLSEVDTEGVTETSQVTGLKNVTQKDEVKKPDSSREELLDCSELPVDGKQVRVLPIIN